MIDEHPTFNALVLSMRRLPHAVARQASTRMLLHGVALRYDSRRPGLPLAELEPMAVLWAARPTPPAAPAPAAGARPEPRP